MDTGTTYSYISTQYATQIYQAVTGHAPPKTADAEGNWQVDCALANSTDFIELSLTHNTDGTAEATPLKLRAPVSSFALEYPYKTTGSPCFWSISPRGDTDGLSDSMLLFGQNFLRNFYVVNNMAQPSMGFAPAVNSKSQVTL
jgi:hypothetical protein